MIGWPCGTREVRPRMKMVGNLGKPVGQTLERAARTRGRALGRVLERRQVAVVAAQTFAQIAGYGLVDRLQIDHLIALDHAEMQRAIGFETDDFHGSLPRLVSPSLLATGGRVGKGAERTRRTITPRGRGNACAASRGRRGRRAGQMR